MDQAAETNTATDTREMTPLEMRRARLRDFADGLLETLETTERPKTHIDIERAARAAMMLDRLITQVFSAPAKSHAPALVSASYAPSASASGAPRSRLPSPRPVSPPSLADHDADDDEAPPVGEAGIEAWEERFNTHFQALIDAQTPGEPLPPEVDDLLNDMLACGHPLDEPPP